jgi:hypothetical protein
MLVAHDNRRAEDVCNIFSPETFSSIKLLQNSPIEGINLLPIVWQIPAGLWTRNTSRPAHLAL